jgi:indole-3-glycerol phosphate synthase
MTNGFGTGEQPGELDRPGPAPMAAGPRDVLAEIVASVRQDLDAAKDRLPRAYLARLAHERAPRGELFASALARPGLVNVIAECKRKSPSRGTLCQDYRPGRIARGYQAAGAAAVSVLTETRFFGGAIHHLREVRREVDLPLLRKDFIVDEYQLLESAATGADAVLLIAAAVDDRELKDLVRRAGKLGLAALVEVHDGWDLERAIEAGAAIVGVNNRDMRTLAVDVATGVKLIGLVPPGVTAVAESGIDSPDALARLRAQGYGAFLIGSHLMSSADPGQALGDLLRGLEEAGGSSRGDG